MLDQFIHAFWHLALGLALGIPALAAAAVLLPKLINRFTPDLDETAEIKKGNQAVAEFFGRVTSAALLGLSLIVAAIIFTASHH